MENYTMYCTEKQTTDAFALGAPIKYAYGLNDHQVEMEIFDYDGQVGSIDLVIPTTDQLIGWLEDTSIRKVKIDSFSHEDYEGWYEEWFYTIFDKNNNNIGYARNLKSRKEATLAAISKALNYLTTFKMNTKQEKRWKADTYGVYYYLGMDDDIFINLTWDNNKPFDDGRYQMGNYFRTKEEAEAMRIKIKELLKGK